MLKTLSGQMLAENHELDRLVSSLPDGDWRRPTAFFGWTVQDQIMHLHQIDGFALAALDGEAAFAIVLADVRAAQAAGVPLSDQARAAFGGIARPEMLARWRATYERLSERLRDHDPKARLPWFGPSMGPLSMASARQMEVWAHGQDIYDLLGVSRSATDRIRNICELGVRTFGWSFRNRGLDVPARPDVGLVAPAGDRWDWPGEGGGAVHGTALDFALLVTQRRAPVDTRLTADGTSARGWLPIAQCFAGAPQEPAAPGSRPADGGAALTAR